MISDNPEDDYYVISAFTYQAECSILYFENEAFKDYIKLNAFPRANVGLMGFANNMEETFPNLKISEPKYEYYYISKSGEFLGNTKEEADKKIREQQISNEQNLEEDEVIQEELQNNIQENIVNNQESANNEAGYNVLVDAV